MFPHSMNISSHTSHFRGYIRFHNQSSTRRRLATRAFHGILREPRPHLYGYKRRKTSGPSERNESTSSLNARGSIHMCGARSSFRAGSYVAGRPRVSLLCIDPCTCATYLFCGIYLHTGFAIGDDTAEWKENTFALFCNVAPLREIAPLVWMLM